MTLPEDREYFSSPSVYRGSIPKGGRSLKNDFWDSPIKSTRKIWFVSSGLLFSRMNVSCKQTDPVSLGI